MINKNLFFFIILFSSILSTASSCKKGTIILEHYPTNDEQLIEKVDTNIYNTWILIKSYVGGPNIRVKCGDRSDCWNTEDNDTLIIHKNNYVEYHPVNGKIRKGKWTINGDGYFLFYGVFDVIHSNSSFRITLKFNRITAEKSPHIILTKFHAESPYRTFTKYYYEQLK
jgi:hypothetical protein